MRLDAAHTAPVPPFPRPSTLVVTRQNDRQQPTAAPLPPQDGCCLKKPRVCQKPSKYWFIVKNARDDL
ncbi:unnamed protein product [Gongylonema pulchrum]|uniref:Uncharacterized protein n=1 Tax=Gongylonema pulchrum TaxID=637853 RepID=A0A183EFV8_9BILA|nr:unnamed protein product [Gongylonema pulchrum]